MYQNNVEGTFKMLEFARKNDVKNFVFASTSTVYGNAKMPTPETEECNPISLYGATKLACENLINSYSNLYGIKSTVLRYANIIGERSDHGVIIDFKNKLKQNPNELEILGNGQQKKSYLYIDDTIEATFTAYKKQTKNYDVFNVGSDESITVNELAELVSNSLNLKPKFKYTSNELKGWKGDVSLMLLDSSKIKQLGWNPKTNINEAIRKIVLNIK
jgi:UDP-glucose 4-epimerase